MFPEAVLARDIAITIMCLSIATLAATATVILLQIRKPTRNTISNIEEVSEVALIAATQAASAATLAGKAGELIASLLSKAAGFLNPGNRDPKSENRQQT